MRPACSIVPSIASRARYCPEKTEGNRIPDRRNSLLGYQLEENGQHEVLSADRPSEPDSARRHEMDAQMDAQGFG
jgi:hypothetical protein